MGWFGTIVGGGLGAMIAGPFGAIIGAALGSSMSAGTQMRSGQGGSASQRQQMLFFTAAFSMVGKLAKADGRICEEEIAAIRRVANEAMGLDEQTRRYAIELLNQSKHTRETFGDYARQFGQLFGQQQDMCQFMLSFLLEVAMADGELHPAEEAMLIEAKQAFRISDSIYQSLYARYVGGQSTSPMGLSQHYETLGVPNDISDAELKKVYRKKVTEYHPDKIEGKGLPPEFIKFANEKLVAINGAYDAITKSRERA